MATRNMALGRAGLAERHLAHEPALPSATSLTNCWKPLPHSIGLAKIAIDDMNALDRPTRCHRLITQSVLALRALAVFGDLPQVDWRT